MSVEDLGDPAYFVQVRVEGAESWLTHAVATSWDSAARAIDRDWSGLTLSGGRPVQYRVVTDAQLMMEGGSAAVQHAVASLADEAYRAARWLEATAAIG